MFYDEGGAQPLPMPRPTSGGGFLGPLFRGQRRQPRTSAGFNPLSRRMRRPRMHNGMPDPKAALLAALAQGILPNTGDPQQPDLAGIIGQHMHGPMQQGASWGGQQFTDPMKLWRWEAGHGNTEGFESFYQHHPGLMNKFDMEVTPPGGGGPRSFTQNLLRGARRRRPRVARRGSEHIY